MNPPIAQHVAADMKSASFIREMFEKGRALKAQFGDANVFDFSLGNPNATPPEAFFAALQAVAAERHSALHRYMPNAGFDETRAAIARFAAREYRLDLDAPSVIVTSGAAGAMNVVLHALCNPGDEVIVLAPYFPEYRFYIQQAGARMVVVPTGPDFQPDEAALAAAITPATRAVIVNTPNNPSGAVYSAEKCAALGALLARHDRPDHPLYLLCDDPYRRILYDLDWCPTPATTYPRTILVSSYSKDVSVAGERLGYILVPRQVPDQATLLAAMIMLNRTLGFVNAPALMQRVIARCADALCDVRFYRENRDLLCDGLRSAGYDLVTPRGALYAFPRTPEDDRAFVDRLVQHRVLAVPGRGFACPGYIRLAFCVDRQTIIGGLPGLRAAFAEARG